MFVRRATVVLGALRNWASAAPAIATLTVAPINTRTQAATWWRQAAAQLEARALRNLAIMFHNDVPLWILLKHTSGPTWPQRAPYTSEPSEASPPPTHSWQAHLAPAMYAQRGNPTVSSFSEGLMRRPIVSMTGLLFAGASLHSSPIAQRSGDQKATLFTGARLITDGDKPPIEDSSFSSMETRSSGLEDGAT